MKAESNPSSTPKLRLATLDDIPAIESLIAFSARALCAADYSPAEVEAALSSVFGCDSELIRDGTYFVVEADGSLAACGGWGRRRTLFGGDKRVGRESELLDPARDAARIRAFFVHPSFARRGIGRILLSRCESEAAAHGFRAAELMATLTGAHLYRQCGYVGTETVEYPVGEVMVRFIPMRKSLDR
jgi:GNAT superfamily N-acetyltransferase